MDQDTAATDQPAYRVLARKYRPTNFEEMIGHEALIKTLTNAIESGRIAQAFMLTGVRGVGKTTTARIIAKALNCIGPDGKGGPTIAPCGVCENCVAITEDRHVDVQELDAASRTGVADIRELIDGVRYRPVAARYKVYILDEVHMLSNNAFNALLKTLEEPPEHVKFIFATTEIRKVPVTVLSRCQRFDLRRVVVDELIGHFRKICDLENVTIEDEAVAIIARAADGSVRDGLSILDQAIALSAGAVDSELVRNMLGLADRGRIFDLMDHIMKGDAVASLEAVRSLYDDGADPSVILQDLMDVTFFLTRMKLVPGIMDDPNIPEIEKTKGREIGGQLGVAQLSRVWQVLMKGLGETQMAPNAIQAAEMVIIRLLHISDLPTPADLVAKLQGQSVTAMPKPSGGGGHDGPPIPNMPVGGPPGNFNRTDAVVEAARAALASGGSKREATEPAPIQGQNTQDAQDLEPNPKSFQGMVALFKRKRQMIQFDTLMRHSRLVDFKPGHVKLQMEKGTPKDALSEIARYLKDWTGQFWTIERVEQQGAQTLMQKEEKRKQANRDEAEEIFLVQQILRKFPESRVVEAEKRGGNDDILAEDIGEAEVEEE